jgi:hypothetical protein
MLQPTSGLLNKVRLKEQNSVTEFSAKVDTNLVTPKARDKNVPLPNKLA